jgi:hypothetical protein
MKMKLKTCNNRATENKSFESTQLAEFLPTVCGPPGVRVPPVEKLWHREHGNQPSGSESAGFLSTV